MVKLIITNTINRKCRKKLKVGLEHETNEIHFDIQRDVTNIRLPSLEKRYLIGRHKVRRRQAMSDKS